MAQVEQLEHLIETVLCGRIVKEPSVVFLPEARGFQADPSCGLAALGAQVLVQHTVTRRGVTKRMSLEQVDLALFFLIYEETATSLELYGLALPGCWPPSVQDFFKQCAINHMIAEQARRLRGLLDQVQAAGHVPICEFKAFVEAAGRD